MQALPHPAPFASAGAERARERTAVLGMVIFLASWAMLFAGLFFAYAVIRLRTPAWPPLDLPRVPLGLPLLATGVLGLSSLVLEGVRRDAVASRGVARGLAGATLLALLFLGLQAVVWIRLWAGGLRPDSGTYASVFFGLTAFHALHVVVGVVALGFLAIRAVLPGAGTMRIPLRLWALYWHMVGIIWAALFLLVYLV